MHLGDELCDLILHQASTNTVREEARKSGMRTLRDSGLLAVYDGITTIEEIIRATSVEQQ